MSENEEVKKKNHLMGWECPKCGCVYSPFTSGCANCNSLTSPVYPPVYPGVAWDSIRNIIDGDPTS